MRTRSATLDLLRIFSALWVLSFHWSGRGGFYPTLKVAYQVGWWPSFLQPISKTGLLGVDVFFILSGAVIANSALNSEPLKFAKARFLRLFPVYFLATLIAIFVAPMAARVVSRKQALFSLSGLQFWTGGSTLVGAAWTIPYEVGFYFLVFLALQYFDKKKSKFDEKRLLIFLNFWLLLIVIAPALNIQAITFLCIENYGSYFVLGACLSQITNKSKFQNYSITMFVALTLSSKELLSRVPEMHHRYLFAGLLLIFTSLIVVSSNFKDISSIFSPRSRAVSIASLMTYPLYLFHETLGMSIISLLNQHGVGIRISYLLTFMFVILLSWISVTYYEPFAKRIFGKLTTEVK